MEGFLQLVSYLLKIQFSLVQLECALRTYLQKIGAAPIRPLTMTTGERRILQALLSILLNGEAHVVGLHNVRYVFRPPAAASTKTDIEFIN